MDNESRLFFILKPPTDPLLTLMQSLTRVGPVPVPGPSTVTVAGPAAGMLRVFFRFDVWVNATPVTAITSKIQPSGLVLGRAWSASIASVGLANAAQPFLILGPGESLDVSNTGTNTANLLYTYYDIPIANRALVRVTANSTTVPVTIIPAAPTGFRNRWLMLPFPNNNPDWITPRASVFAIGDDSTALTLVQKIGSDIVSRSGPVGQNSIITSTQNGSNMLAVDLNITTDALTGLTSVTPTSRGINIAGVYETSPL